MKKKPLTTKKADICPECGYKMEKLTKGFFCTNCQKQYVDRMIALQNLQKYFMF